MFLQSCTSGFPAFQFPKHPHIDQIYIWSQAQTLIINTSKKVSIFILLGLTIKIDIFMKPFNIYLHESTTCEDLSQRTYVMSIIYIY